jgi:biopolymer transport protein ExbD
MSGTSTRDINVTPLIDVLLVLLIIFLVIMPMMAKLVPVELPPKSEDAVPETPPLILKLQTDLSIAVDDGPPQLASELPQISKLLTRGKHVFVDAESTVPWNEVVQLMDRVRGLAPSPDAVQIAVRIHDPVE